MRDGAEQRDSEQAVNDEQRDNHEFSTSRAARSPDCKAPSIHPVHDDVCSPAKWMPPSGAGNGRHECTHLARLEHGKRAARPGIQRPSLDEPLFELRANRRKGVGDQADAEREAVLGGHVEDRAADTPANRGAENSASGS